MGSDERPIQTAQKNNSSGQSYKAKFFEQSNSILVHRRRGGGLAGFLRFHVKPILRSLRSDP